jgi:hypothetical protein
MTKWFLVGVLVSTASTVHAQGVSCMRCHDQIPKLFTGSAHALAGMTCVDCHGGDPKVADESVHVTDNFHKPGDKKAIAEFCASCHSDVRKMNPYGLPTDQLERYKTSKHGEQLFQHNDKNVATCTDCHGVHDILKPDSPQSHVHPKNIPDTCGRCHAKESLMSQYKIPSDVVAQYKTSYHATMLFEKGDLSAPTCVTCHGNHGAMPPGTREVGQVCGKCHGRQRELFEKSPHAEAAAAGLFSECVACHGNHAIQRASIDLFDATCIRCHERDKKPKELRDNLAGMIRKAKDRYAAAEKTVHDATVRGLSTDDAQMVLQEAKTDVTQMEALQHALSLDLVEPVSQHAQKSVDAVLADIAHLENVELWKRRALLPIWGFFGLMAVLFWAKHRELEK